MRKNLMFLKINRFGLKISGFIERKKIQKNSNRISVIFKSVFVLPVLLISPSAFSSDRGLTLPYQKCKEDNEKFTSHVAKKAKEFNILQTAERTEAGYCSYCPEKQGKILAHQDAVMRMANYKTYKTIPSDCFLAASLRGAKIIPKKRSAYCKNKDFENEFPTGTKKYCINKAYVDMISKAFSDMSYCFNLSEREQADFFHLINHESGFILNARSQSKARCLGQLTSSYVGEINKIIKGEKHRDFGHFYKEVVLNRCPELEKKILPNFHYLTCKTTHDPYTCLFYTFFDLKRNYNTISQKLNSPLDYMGNKEFEAFRKKAFKLPVKLNEILHVEGEVYDPRIKSGKKVNWVLWDDSELFPIIQKYKFTKEELKSLRITKLPLFQDSDRIARIITAWSHNGGSSVASGLGPVMIRKLKQNIAIGSGCSNPPKKRRCIFRKKIQGGESLSVEETRDYIKSYLRRNYPTNSSGRRKEVVNYMDNILSNSDYLLNGKSQSKSQYKKEILGNQNLEGDGKQKEQFVNHFRKVCPRASL